MTAQDNFDRIIHYVLEQHGRDQAGYFRFVSTIRVMRDMTLRQADVRVPGPLFTQVNESLERLAARGSVQKRELDDETVQWRAIGLLDALAVAADEEDDD